MNGVFRDVVIDDQYPWAGNACSFAKSKDRKESWVQVLEKAYAKLHGSYDAIEGGFVSDALVDMTAGIGEQFDLRSTVAKQQIADGSMWARIAGLVRDGHLLGCGSNSGTDTNQVMGIVLGHAYSILGAEEVDGHRLIKCRNPHGRTEWEGKWSDGDTKSWTQRMKKKLNHTSVNDGSFWMEFEDFVVHFRNVYVCRILGTNWQHRIVQGGWKGPTAGGCSNFPTNKNNIQYVLELKRKLRVLITLEQNDARGTDHNLFCIGMHLYKSHASGGRQGCSFLNSGTFTNSREVCIEADLDPGTVYAVPTTFNAGEETDFSIKLFWHGGPQDVSLTAAS